jgi:molecular chaperone DnaK (HSP70)
MSGHILILFISVLVAVSAVLSALGFKGRVEVIGIDLGTTYSVAAVSEGGRVRVFEDPVRGKLTASTVAFLQDGGVLVGASARRHALKEPKNVVYDAKRFIGRKFDDPTVAEQAKKYAFEVVENTTSHEAAFKIHGRVISPARVGAEVVKALLQTVHENLGHENVKRAVIAVPASFGPAQIAATGEAFKAAGLRVARVMPEPVAAAVAYGLHKKPDINHVLVFDFGGGTLDVSILYVQKGSIEVVANGGDNDLGGTDFDTCIVEDLTKQVSSVAALDDTCDDFLTTEPCAPHVLAQLAEEMKVSVSSSDTVTRTCAARTKKGCAELELILTKKRFEKVCGYLFERALKTVDDTLVNGMLTKADVDEVVLVGGTSRIPHMRDLLRKSVGVAKLNVEIDPDVTVAIGAASILD